MVGKILSDTANVDSLNIKEKDFLVVMVSKVASLAVSGKELTKQPKKAAPAPTPAPAPAAEPTPAASTSTPAPAAPATESAPAESAAPTTESSSASTGSGPGFGGGSFRMSPSHEIYIGDKADDSLRPRTSICYFINDGNGIREGSSDESYEGEL